MKKVLSLVFVLSMILMSFQCVDEIDEVIVANNFKATISSSAISNSTISTSDTIWISGRVSSMAFDESLGDSIPSNGLNNGDLISLFKLRPADNQGNSIDAVDKFEVIQEIGQVSAPTVCANSGLSVVGALSQDETEYAYRIGLKPNTVGDYAFLWEFDTSITNIDRNTEILANYPIDGNTQTIEFNKCNIISILPNIDNTEKLYFFSVE